MHTTLEGNQTQAIISQRLVVSDKFRIFDYYFFRLILGTMLNRSELNKSGITKTKGASPIEFSDKTVPEHESEKTMPDAAEPFVSNIHSSIKRINLIKNQSEHKKEIIRSFPFANMKRAINLILSYPSF